MRFFIIIFLFFSIQSFSQIDVTFRVDMQYQLVSVNGVFIAGSMQDWSTFTPLLDEDGDDIWEVTLTISENTIYNYKFINGDIWESVFGSCAEANGNRTISTSNQGVLLPAYVFNSCETTTYGCTDENALNYDSSANNDDGSCEYPPGCTDPNACNYDSQATIDDGSCIFAPQGYDCDSNCIAPEITWFGDQNNDGFVSVDPNSGSLYITIESFPNFLTATASIFINGQEYPMSYADWGNNAHWYHSIESSANNSYNWTAEISNLCATTQSYTDSFVTDCQNIVNGTSLDLGCGCGLPAQQIGYDCEGNCLLDTDMDGVCDEFEINGCTDALATNYNTLATEDDGSCEYLLVEGCVDIQACNYNPLANFDNNSCIYIDIDLPNDTVICSSSQIEIIIEDTNYSYLWDNGATTNTVVINQAGTYFVTIIDESGCQVSDSINISHSPIPFIDVGDVFYLCTNSDVNLELFNNWKHVMLLDFETGDTITENTLISIDTPGEYQLFVTDSLGCVGYDIFEIIEAPNPLANFEFTFSDNQLSTTNLSSNANHFEWNIIHHDETIQDTVENLSVEIELCNNDTILLLAYNNCGVDSISYVFNPTKLDIEELKFSVYPNPFQDILLINGYEKFERYSISDLNGRLIKSGKILNKLNFDELKMGFYNLTLHKSNKYLTKKLFKH